MNTVGAVAKIGLSPEEFAGAFPFHFAFDPEGRIVQMGPSLRRLCSDAISAADWTECFQVIRPEGLNPEFAHLCDETGRFVLLGHRATGLQLRGAFTFLRDANRIVFLGSPWLTDAAEIQARGLSIDDFAPHDPVVDMLHLSQAGKVALDDARKLTARLTVQRAELRAVNEQMRRQEAEARKLALIASRTHNAVILTDAAGLVDWVNEGFIRLTGYSLEEIRGRKPGSMLQGPATDRETVGRIAARISAGEGVTAELLNYNKSGQPYWVALEIQPIRDDSGQLTHFMAIETDITERREAQQRLTVQFEIARVLGEAPEFSAAIPNALRAIGETLGWPVAQFWQVDGERLRWGNCWRASAPGRARRSIRQRRSLFQSRGRLARKGLAIRRAALAG